MEVGREGGEGGRKGEERKREQRRDQGMVEDNKTQCVHIILIELLRRN